MPQLKQMKVADLLTDTQVRKSFDQRELDELIASVKAVGILLPLLVDKAGKLIAGHRRLLAAKAAGLETVPVMVKDDVPGESQTKVLQLIENMQRSALTEPEIFVACQELLALNPSWKQVDLAKHLHIHPTEVTRIQSVNDLCPAAKAAFMAGKFGFSKAYALSKVTPEQQVAMIESSRDDIQKAGRVAREESAPKPKAVRAAKVKCLLPSGYTVTVSGGNVSLDEAAEALADAIKEMKRARDMGYTAKTFAAAMADRAKKG